jgi:hypothetical protein
MATVLQLNGLEIVAFGRPRQRPDDPVEMEDFAVRAVGGDPAVVRLSGVMEADGPGRTPTEVHQIATE